MGTLADEFEAWERTPPEDLVGDPIWRLPAYRLALFLASVTAHDVVAVAPSRVWLAEQVERSIAAISANIAEGYGRTSGRDRARFFEIACGSAREAREWYRRLSPVLGENTCAERMQLLTRLIKILTVAIPQERAGSSEARLRRARKEG